MDAVAALQQVHVIQYTLKIIATLMLTAFLFPRTAVVTDEQEYDFVIVGAGSSGIVVALRLSECNYSVLLIDDGDDPPVQSLAPGLFPFLSNTKYDWNFTHVKSNCLDCHRDRILNLTSGHVLGGGSSINYMFYVRGCPGDFEPWAAAARDSSWGYAGLLPYFIKSERLEDREVLSSRYRSYHGTRGFLGVTRQPSSKTYKYLEAVKELGHDVLLDINGDHRFGYTQQMFTIAGGVRQSTAYTILAGFNKPDIDVLKKTFVTKVLLDGNNIATGVKAITRDDKILTIKARKEVILAAGAINTPRLLMGSGIGPRDHLESLSIPVRVDLPVGKNLQDHVPIIMSFKMENSKAPPPPINPIKFPFPTFTGYVALNKSDTCPIYQAINFVVPSNSMNPLQLCVFNYNFDFDICQKLYEGGINRNTMFTTLSLLHPESRGEVLLSSANPKDPPLIDVKYLSERRDLETLVDSAIDFVRILNTTYFRSVNAEMTDLKLRNCEGLEYFSRPWWRCYVQCMMVTLYHYTGTCALGSVVDNHLRVFGVGRLRVVDASVAPTLVSANINAAVIATAEKAADTIKKDHFCRANTTSNRKWGLLGNVLSNWNLFGWNKPNKC